MHASAVWRRSIAGGIHAPGTINYADMAQGFALMDAEGTALRSAMEAVSPANPPPMMAMSQLDGTSCEQCEPNTSSTEGSHFRFRPAHELGTCSHIAAMLHAGPIRTYVDISISLHAPWFHPHLHNNGRDKRWQYPRSD